MKASINSNECSNINHQLIALEICSQIYILWQTAPFIGSAPGNLWAILNCTVAGYFKASKAVL
jgi:hypothetical protein